MRIGLLGGTFDPFHRGHLEPVLAVRDAMAWDEVRFIPAWKQPFKRDTEHASGFHRFAMAVLATEDVDGCTVSDMELDRGAVSYTVDTLEELHRDGGDSFDWIIGDDNLPRLGEWRELDRIFALANFVVLSRNPGAAGEAVPERFRDRVMDAAVRGRSGAIVFATNPMVPVSSTEIRRRVRESESIDQLVDPRVSRYIHHYGLYRKAGS